MQILCQLLTEIFAFNTHKHRFRASFRPTTSSFLSTLFFSGGNGHCSTTSAKSYSRMNVKPSRTLPLPSELSNEVDAEIDTHAARRQSKSSTSSKITSRLRTALRPSMPRSKSSGAAVSTVSADGERTMGPAVNAVLPRAAVISGLEHVNLPCQRLLLRTLQEKCVTLADGRQDADERTTWPLAEDFLLVYVCPWDPRERPGIHKNLV